eukprot:121184-Heterocapsa_arctica.AAC.1
MHSVDLEEWRLGAKPLAPFPPSASSGRAVPWFSGWTKGGEPHPDDHRSCESWDLLHWEPSWGPSSTRPVVGWGGPSPGYPR